MIQNTSLEVDEWSYLAVGRSRFKHTFDYRLYCPHCRATKMTQHPNSERQVWCENCKHAYSSNSFATNALRTLCDSCGYAALLFTCGAGRLCAICAKKWDEAGRTGVITAKFTFTRPVVAGIFNLAPILTDVPRRTNP